jgi:hypothetical protein
MASSCGWTAAMCPGVRAPLARSVGARANAQAHVGVAPVAQDGSALDDCVLLEPPRGL